jgi:hypothetical protein
MLRSAFSLKNQKKKSEKKFQKIFREILFQIFFAFHGSTSNLEHACEIFGGLGPLVWEEIENGSLWPVHQVT